MILVVDEIHPKKKGAQFIPSSVGVVAVWLDGCCRMVGWCTHAFVNVPDDAGMCVDVSLSSKWYIHHPTGTNGRDAQRVDWQPKDHCQRPKRSVTGGVVLPFGLICDDGCVAEERIGIIGS